ncbi:hypothetical protein [Bifidobacterium myosotis]|uniref:hypothetical protein n=1 Tax=Bifidobacterium myosotis TaxID=1630166 RepID=UPI00168B0A7D|nr:hypothetical protein [Bifidobacterium myosotis]
MIDPRDMASRIAIRLQSMSRNDLVTFIIPRILRNLWRAARDIHMNDKVVSNGD